MPFTPPKTHTLRIALTERCTLRCAHCSSGGYTDVSLPCDEAVRIVRAVAALGVRYVQLTGGEPLLYGDLIPLCEELSAIEGLREVTLCTNGTFLRRFARTLRKTGLHSVEVGIPTLDSTRYRTFTNGGSLADALDGLRAAAEAGFFPIRIGTVLIDGVNDDEITSFVDLTRNDPLEIRFYELVGVGCAQRLVRASFLPRDLVLRTLPELIPLPYRLGMGELYCLPEATGKVALIASPKTALHAADGVLRLTADGFLKPTVDSRQEFFARRLSDEQLQMQLMRAMAYTAPEDAPFEPLGAHEERDMIRIGG